MARPSDPPVFFVDRSLGSVDVAAALRKAGALVEIHDDHFKRDAPDTEWLTAVGAKGWVVLTKDARIRRRAMEHEALIRAGVAAFVLTGAGLPAADMAAAFTKALIKMARLVVTRTKPFIATVSPSGKVAIVEGGARKGSVRR